MKIETLDVVRAIHALKSLQPQGSKHYQSGWDDGLEAAMDAVRELASLAGGRTSFEFEGGVSRTCCYDSSVTDCRHFSVAQCCVPADEVCPTHH